MSNKLLKSVPRIFSNKFNKDISTLPNLIKVQRDSYNNFIDLTKDKRDSNICKIFASIFPILDSTNKLVSLELADCYLEAPKYNEYECTERGTTYFTALKAVLRLIIRENIEDKVTVKNIKEQSIYVGNIPVMTTNGTFIINGIERVIVSQIHRSAGVLFTCNKTKTLLSNKLTYCARIIPYRGSWLDIELSPKKLLYFRVDKKRKLPISVLLYALNMSFQEILHTFYDRIEYIKHDSGKWQVPFIPSKFKNIKLINDLVDASTNEIVLRKGTRISSRLAEKLHCDGLKHYLVDYENIIGHYTITDINDQDEKILFIGQEITHDISEKIKLSQIDRVSVLDTKYSAGGYYIRDTICAHKVLSQNDALIEIHEVVRPGESSSIEAAQMLFRNLFFNSDYYDLLNVGRIKLNERLDLNHSEDTVTLTKEDITATIATLVRIFDGVEQIDDMDHLSNRRVRSVGEFIENHFRVGLAKVARVTLENISTASDINTIMPCDLLNVKPLALIKDFFVSSQLSQFLDQTNPLSEVTHKRRLSAIGPGGLTRERAGFEVRDVHPSHYGRICPIETPEGQTIGLISSLATYARINKYGFIESPYRKVENGSVIDKIDYLSATLERKYNIIQANTKLNPDNTLGEDTLYCRSGNSFAMVSREEIDYMDLSPQQTVSVAASLIPFLENDDASRALMGSNMQRQAVPLLHTEAPIVGTGMEGVIAYGSGVVCIAKRDGIVKRVDADCIIIHVSIEEDKGVDIYDLQKFKRTNHSTCKNQIALVSVGDYVKKGDIIADGSAIDDGELALGRNVIVAFMSWRGFNFEDSILISRNLIKDDYFTSIHIEEFECAARDIRLGSEEITCDIPNVNAEHLSHLDEFGIVHIGAEIKAGDILVGKVTPKSETSLTPEEKLLRAIFGEKSMNVTDSSLYVPPGIVGTVIDVKISVRRGLEKNGRVLLIEQQVLEPLKKKYDYEISLIKDHIYKQLSNLLINRKTTQATKHISKNTLITTQLLSSIPREEHWKLVTDNDIQLLYNELNKAEVEAKSVFDTKIHNLSISDDLPQGVLYVVKVFVAIKHNLQPGDKMSGRHGNKGVISRVVAPEDMPYLADGTPVDIVLNPLGVPSRMNIGQILETHLGWICFKLKQKITTMLNNNVQTECLRQFISDIYKKDPHIVAMITRLNEEELEAFARKLANKTVINSPVFVGVSEEDMQYLATLADVEDNGRVLLYDGYTGEPFDRKVTVGIIYMLKLHHLVDYKIHARSVGPYSLVAQQPLGGKAHSGGQRVGEMEVWALKAYGAAYTLQEILTIKSDDIVGRVMTYEAIIKGSNKFKCGVPESFHVLISELRALNLKIELQISDAK